jgi:hypothetical protein
MRREAARGAAHPPSLVVIVDDRWQGGVEEKNGVCYMSPF